jgi:hypothetical protein
MKEPRFKTILAASPVQCLIDADKEKFLSLASIENLKKIIPAEILGSGK